MFKQVRIFLEMIRFSHTVFALPFALLSAALGWHTKEQGFQTIELVGILLCMLFARSAAMGFNRLADRKIDAENPRTAQRHIPAGKISTYTVAGFTLFCSLAFIGSTLLFFLAEPANPWPITLALPVLIFICAYSYTKRFTSLSHFWLGASLLLAPLAAWIAIRGLDGLLVPTILGFAVMFWVAGFDIIYACQDMDFDRQAKLSSIPAQFGVVGALRIALGCHILMSILLVALYWAATPTLGYLYLCGISAVAILLIWQHFLVSPNDLTRVNMAFFNVNAIVSLGLFLVVLLQLYIGW